MFMKKKTVLESIFVVFNILRRIFLECRKVIIPNKTSELIYVPTNIVLSFVSKLKVRFIISTELMIFPRTKRIRFRNWFQCKEMQKDDEYFARCARCATDATTSRARHVLIINISLRQTRYTQYENPFCQWKGHDGRLFRERKT